MKPKIKTALTCGLSKGNPLTRKARKPKAVGRKPQDPTNKGDYSMNSNEKTVNAEEPTTTPQVFSNPGLGYIRIVAEGDKVFFCGKDVAEALGYSRARDAIAQHCKGAVKRRALTVGGKQSMTFIPEGDVYRLICNSTLPTAEKFERWVFDEVLPSIRKHGGYLTPEKVEEALLNPDVLIRLATELKQEREQRKALEAQCIENEPKVLFADAVSASKTEILVGDMAKIIKQNGVDIGQKRLFEWLRDNGYLMRQKGTSYNMPTQRAMELGLFRVKETAITHSDGSITVSKTVKVTGRGQIYLANTFLKHNEVYANRHVAPLASA